MQNWSPGRLPTPIPGGGRKPSDWMGNGSYSDPGAGTGDPIGVGSVGLGQYNRMCNIPNEIQPSIQPGGLFGPDSKIPWGEMPGYRPPDDWTSPEPPIWEGVGPKPIDPGDYLLGGWAWEDRFVDPPGCYIPWEYTEEAMIQKYSDPELWRRPKFSKSNRPVIRYISEPPAEDEDVDLTDYWECLKAGYCTTDRTWTEKGQKALAEQSSKNKKTAEANKQAWSGNKEYHAQRHASIGTAKAEAKGWGYSEALFEAAWSNNPPPFVQGCYTTRIVLEAVLAVLTIGQSVIAAQAARAAAAALAARNTVRWGFWSQLPKVVRNGRLYAKIGQYLYTRHAIERMIPRAFGYPGVTRGYPPLVVEEILKHGWVSRSATNPNRWVWTLEGAGQVVTEGWDIVISVGRRLI